jgi:hypothetical protein
MNKALRENVSDFVVVSLLYLLAFKLTEILPGFLFWGGTINETSSAALVFLPHGVRVLVAWLYGYRSILLLAPASYLTHYYRIELVSFDLALVIAPIFGIICAAFTFDVCARLGFDVRLKSRFIANWRSVFLVGALSSVLNSLGTNFAHGNDFKTTTAYWFGDVCGLFVTMFLLMIAFKVMRTLRPS